MMENVPFRIFFKTMDKRTSRKKQGSNIKMEVLHIFGTLDNKTVLTYFSADLRLIMLSSSPSPAIGIGTMLKL